ncbi:bifunctional folylpolyglutamate synthase/dihydrofolate synthase [Sphingomonas sanxanigenens]|uniref:tetrahydrofolate synthase n=1 Tax=Sphingomonas sanxanigenens DSM 19645 = NX02 TaxID=1123269 RepID=W0A807_9SPHN|nr:folylpolyglutamate synthase/dihydrofolate synthase family protein [Sphingomonas sanxanigenens]AHE54044.1 hypothetical protein NX02_11675 [Sphingomonas sanxanigenens DSM 19645 = NX02]
MDYAVSTDPAVQHQLDRLAMLSPGRDVLGLERITLLLDRLGNPQHRLPPVFHVAGTNGKGSTCAYLRAAIEAAGLTAHVYSSPHLVRFNERIRIAGRLIDDATLAPLLAEVLDGAEDINPSFFETTTAAAFLAFARTPADACIVEVGLGGRLDATNVVARPAVCGIARLGIDHEAFLGDTIIAIAREKAGIAKRGVPLVMLDHPAAPLRAVADAAAAAGADFLPGGTAWRHAAYRGQLHYRDAQGVVTTPLPRLPGAHQQDNLALAIAMLRHQKAVPIPAAALSAAPLWAQWPARLQLLDHGPLTDLLPAGSRVWLDGGHNPAAGEAIAAHFHDGATEARPLHLILGMLANKDPLGLLKPFVGLATSISTVPVPGHEHHDPAGLAALASELGIAGLAAADPRSALARIARGSDPAQPPAVLILGSLYLAGTILAANNQSPD